MTGRATQQFTRGQTILLEDTPGDSTYRILSGEVIICKKSPATGEQVAIARLGAGDMFGEMYLFNKNLNRTASAIALSNDVNLEVLPQEEVRTMMKGLHPAINRIFEGLSLRLHKISGKYVHAVGVQKAQTEQLGATTDSDTYIHRPPVE